MRKNIQHHQCHQNLRKHAKMIQKPQKAHNPTN